MNSENTRYRRPGQPVVVFVAIALAWIGVRAAFWDASVVEGPAHARTRTITVERAAPSTPLADGMPTSSPQSEARAAAPIARAASGIGTVLHKIGPAQVAATGQESTPPMASSPTTLPHALSTQGPIDHMPARSKAANEVPVVRAGSEASNRRRWHVDGWYAWRSGSGQPRVVAGGPRAPAYGGTQGGFAVRYELADSGRRPQIYLRATHAPDRPSQSDLALGLGLRPVPSVPVRIQGEARATRILGNTEIRPAVAAITELAPASLPLGFRVEAYAQAGFVGGSEATAFVDGQVRADRALVSLGKTTIRLGGGAWGGAQKYAERLDMGPGVTLDLRDAGLPARLSVDYRVRVAGHARPSDGPAVTFSTGF